jgi:serine/threonine-protein kinase
MEPLQDRSRARIELLDLAVEGPLDPGRLVAELERHARVVHPHLAEVLAVGRDGERVWIARPELEGAVSLRTWLERETRLPFLEAVRVLRECAQALAHAHAQGSLHLDLRPERVLWSETHVRLEGLGVRQALRAVRGAPADPLGASEDVRALGALGYEILVGEPPPARPPLPSPTARRAHVPPGLARLLVRCLAPEPLRRPSIGEALRLLEGLVTPVADWNAQLENQARYLAARGLAAEASERLSRLPRLRPGPGGR